jgi:hypothetical protein
MAARFWTLEQRQRQREAIQSWKPWERSTGPKSPEGKERVRQNGWKGGAREMLRKLARALKGQREWLDT